MLRKNLIKKKLSGKVTSRERRIQPSLVVLEDLPFSFLLEAVRNRKTLPSQMLVVDACWMLVVEVVSFQLYVFVYVKFVLEN
jgi:hypothetical protein